MDVVGTECPYRILGIQRKAEEIDIITAYTEKLARIDEEEKDKVKRAFATLSDCALRLEYKALYRHVSTLAP